MFVVASRRKQYVCPLCRLPVRSSTDIVDLKDFTAGREKAGAKAAVAEAGAAEGCNMIGSRDGQHGSKLQRVAEVLRGILVLGDERAIVFCQFADLELQISKALDDVGIAHARLSAARDIFEQTAVLDRFQQKKGHERVLLLSLEQSASGTNLTAANHVLLIHPMAASTAERAVAFEQQAIGRCVRLGQKRTVTVWRFVTRGTVEELLDRRFADQRRCYGNGTAALPVMGALPLVRAEPAGSPREAIVALRHEAGRRRGTSTRIGARSSSETRSRRSGARSGSMAPRAEQP